MTCPSDCTFDPVTHVYKIDGAVVPSVTQIINERNLIAGKEFWTEAARDRGSAVHKIAEYHMTGVLDVESIDPALTGYYDALLAFIRDMQIEPLVCERQLFHRRYRYAGTLDLLAYFSGKPRPALFDFKTGSYSAWMAMQLEAYKELVMENADELAMTAADIPEESYVVLLQPDGRYKLEPAMIGNHNARQLFMSALQLTHFASMEKIKMEAA